AEPDVGRQPAEGGAHVAPGEDREQHDQQSGADQRLEPGLHERRAIRMFWSASSPTAHTTRAPMMPRTALSERLSRVMSKMNFATPATKSIAPTGRNTFSGLKKTIVRRIRIVKSSACRGRIFDWPRRA